jgi:hypothetical protein
MFGGPLWLPGLESRRAVNNCCLSEQLKQQIPHQVFGGLAFGIGFGIAVAAFSLGPNA